jgi:DNA modification methylase
MKNKIYYGDNLDVLRRYIKDETVDLCYIDPPFNSKRNYNQIYNNVGTEDKAQAQAFIDTWTWDDDAIKGLGEIQSNYHGVFTEQSIDLITGLEKVLKKGALLAYLVSMTLRIAEIHWVLKPTGSFYFHCDPTASHYLKLVLDAIFCPKGGDFQNEISWCYGSGGASKKHYSKKHDVIFFYTKSDKYSFNVDDVREPYSSPHKSMTPKVVGDKSYVKMNPLGRIPFDWWQIPILTNSAKERMGYPTQKPEALLEVIIKASSNEGDTILDAYCGCGTTVAVAEKLKRNWIGIDITYQSISLILKRLAEQSKGALDNIDINGVPKDMDSAIALANNKDDRTRKEFEKWLVLTYSNNHAIINEKKGGDGGIDGIAYIPDRDETKKALFSVKSSKTLTPSMINELHGVVERDGAACGIFLCLYPAANLVKASKAFGVYHNDLINKDYPKIQVVCVDDIFNGKRLELPNVVKVLKKAEQHQEQLGIEALLG